MCQRFGISIQPARIREGRDKARWSAFSAPCVEGCSQYLPGYKGPDINARGLDVEGHAFFYIDQLEAIVREWIATVYHHTRHSSLFDLHLPAATMTPGADVRPRHSTAAVVRDLRGFGVSALIGAVTAALFGVCEDSRIGRGRRGS